MEAIREYLLSVIAAAILSGIAVSLLGKKGTIGATVKLLSGVVMILTVAGPLADIRLDGQLALFSELTDDAYVASGENSAREAMAEIIKAKTEAYILDKAEELGVTLSVTVSLSQEQIPTPSAVILTGNVSPYAKQSLAQMLVEDLGISTEAQTWILQG